MEYPDKVTSIWSVEDVDTWLNDNDERISPPLTEWEKRRALHVMEEDFDASYGFNWDTLGAAVKKVVRERAMLS